jgi:hypothetical protein
MGIVMFDDSLSIVEERRFLYAQYSIPKVIMAN